MHTNLRKLRVYGIDLAPFSYPQFSCFVNMQEAENGAKNGL